MLPLFCVGVKLSLEGRTWVNISNIANSDKKGAIAPFLSEFAKFDMFTHVRPLRESLTPTPNKGNTICMCVCVCVWVCVFVCI